MFKKTILYSIPILSVILFWNCAVEDQPQRISEKMSAHLAYLPDSGIGLVYLNLNSAKDSEFVKKFTNKDISDYIRNRYYKEFVRQTGFDLQENLDEIYMAFIPEKKDEEQTVFLYAKGSFNEEKIISYISDKEYEPQIEKMPYRDWTVYMVDENEFCFAFADSTTLVLSKEDMTKSFLDKFADGNDSKAQQHWLRMVKPVQYKNYGFFAAEPSNLMNTLGKQWKDVDIATPFESINKIRQFNMSLNLSETIAMSGYGHFSDDQTAELFHDALKGAIATAKLSVSEDRSAVDVFNKIDIDLDGTAVRVKFEFSEEELNSIIDREYNIARLN